MPEISSDTAGKKPAARLSGWERVAVGLGRGVNETRFGKAAQEQFLRTVPYIWIRASLAQRMFVEGLDEMMRLDPPGGVLLVANHRSFFDLYAVMLALWMGPVAWARHLYFPVRSHYFYDHPLGALINFAVGGGVMYPPIFRERERTELNRDAIHLMQRLLRTRQSLVGVHPEGRRNTGDPYDLLPAQPGVGELALQAKPLVVPIFINGMSNNLLRDIRSNYQRDIRRTNPAICVIGAPVDCDDLYAVTPRPALYKRAADRFRDGIMAAGAREKELRTQCAAGDMPDSHPNWLSNRGRGHFYASRR
jgi:1-acyl-sn-glycerol-3-phosphate acyltransferase